MDWDELEPKQKKPAPRNLETMGVAELNAYIAELEAEITRARAAIAAKQSARAGAESFFKK
ncbi:MAG TPA: DUF1192 domain-containing protein [Magnetospirillum sp.]|jgi:uncharacterized small protein (DUF1192 family)|nr:DUF1192 domain-containing protein [Magnetospirillum sp.]